MDIYKPKVQINFSNLLFDLIMFTFYSILAYFSKTNSSSACNNEKNNISGAYLIIHVYGRLFTGGVYYNAYMIKQLYLKKNIPKTILSMHTF